MNWRTAILASILAVTLALPSCTTPPWVMEAENIAKVALPIVQGIAAIVGAGPAITQAVNDLNLIITLFDQYKAAPSPGGLASIQSGLNAVNADLGQIMPAAHVEDSATQSKVAAIVQLVASEFSQIAAVVEASAPNPKAGARQGVSAPPPALDNKKFKKDYNAIIAGDPRFPKL